MYNNVDSVNYANNIDNVNNANVAATPLVIDEVLPDEIMLNIFSSIPLNNTAIRLVSRKWMDLSDDPQRWSNTNGKQSKLENYIAEDETTKFSQIARDWKIVHDFLIHLPIENLSQYIQRAKNLAAIKNFYLQSLELIKQGKTGGSLEGFVAWNDYGNINLFSNILLKLLKNTEIFDLCDKLTKEQKELIDKYLDSVIKPKCEKLVNQKCVVQ